MNQRAVPAKASDSLGCALVAVILTVLALIPCGCGVYLSRAAAKPALDEITPQRAEDRQAVPSGSFVVLRGRPDLDHIVEVTGNVDHAGAVLLTLEGARASQSSAGATTSLPRPYVAASRTRRNLTPCGRWRVGWWILTSMSPTSRTCKSTNLFMIAWGSRRGTRGC